MPENQIEIMDGVLTLREDGIVEIRHKPNEEQTLESARAQIVAIRKLADGNLPAPLLVITGLVKGQTREARRYLTRDSDIVETVSACAIVVNTPVARALASAFLGLTRPAIPLSVFDSEEKAADWLLDSLHE